MGVEEEDSEESWARTTSLGGEPMPALPLPLMAVRRREPSAALPVPQGAGRREPSAGSPAAPSTEGKREQIGRYVLLRTLGEGGMGVVWAAYDPELERKVALKILREGLCETSTGAVRLRREAQAMARLSHPNVAQVYEVGEDAGRLFLAIEYLQGVTLKTWMATPHPWREVLRVFGEAGRGLAAAHAAGLMHRDFKPDNAMLAEDGRVRVLDFGLSRLHAEAVDEPSLSSSGRALAMTVTGAGTLLGTPAYMSPEQHLRGETDARSDQFSFCVALWEGLYGERPFAGRTTAELGSSVLRGAIVPPVNTRVPTWIRRVLERGLAVEAAKRWPTMDALLAALDRDPQRTRRRWLAVSAGVLAIAATSYGAARVRGAEVAVCEGAAEEIAGAWGAEQRAAVEQAVRATGAAYADRVAATSVQRLDEFAAQWAAVHTAACVSHRRGHTSPQLFDRRMGCLRQRHRELAATASVLAQTTRETVAQAAEAARGLPAVALCEDDARLLAAVAPPEDAAAASAVEEVRGRLARVQALERSGRFTEGWQMVAPLVVEAEVLGYQPLQAEVELMAGKVQMHRALWTEAEEHLERALRHGIEAGFDEVAAESRVLAIYVTAYGERRPAEARKLEGLTWALIRRVKNPPHMTAMLHNNLGVMYGELGDKPRSLAEFNRALELLVVHEPDGSQRWATANNLANELNTAGQHAKARAIASEAHDRLVEQYGACNPFAASLLMVVANSEARLGEVGRGVADYEAAIACFVGEYPMYEVIARHELGSFYLLWGNVTAARQQLAAAEALLATAPEARAEALAVALLRADIAIDELRLADAESTLVAWRTTLATDGRADALAAVEAQLGRVALLTGDAVRAEGHLKAAEEHGASRVAGVRGLYAFTLARTLHALGRGQERVPGLLDEASAAYVTMGAPYAGRVAEITAWRREVGASPAAPPGP